MAWTWVLILSTVGNNAPASDAAATDAPGEAPNAAKTPAPAATVLERRELPGGLVREKLLCPGWDPTDPVPAIAIYPAGVTALPVVVLLHWLRGSKEAMEPWAGEIASRGLFVLAIDCYLHGERQVAGVLERPDLPSLGEEYSVYVHQASIAHTSRDFPRILESLAGRSPEVDLGRVGVAGISMGGSLALVLAWQHASLKAAVSLVGAGDFWWDVTKLPPGPEMEAKKSSYGARVRRLVDSIDPLPRIEKIPPKALFVASGRGDPFIAVDSMERLSSRLKDLYAKCPDRFKFRVEDVGHEATATMRQEANEWLARFLSRPAGSAIPETAR